MKHTIVKMQNKIEYYDYALKKHISYNAYAFIDSDGHCIIIVAGEKRRDLMSEYLSETEIWKTKSESANAEK